jgi:hypothetical protein
LHERRIAEVRAEVRRSGAGKGVLGVSEIARHQHCDD